MNPPTPGIESILAEAVEIPSAADREVFLDRACGPDTALRERVGKLAADHFRAGSFLEHPPLAIAPGQTADFDPTAGQLAAGAAVGPYRVRELLGEGGMGAVYVADQEQPVRRRVALKVIKPGMDSREVVARFEAERQALALMDHPGIAKVLDGGSTAEGRPYFVMELVRGLLVTDYCDQARQPARDRLALFAEVCRAVQHAHQKGVIHRDLKPSNVLVTVIDGKPVPKVIDFGVAKAVGAALTDKTVYTGFARLVGTPLYMSPEQAELSGVDVDTRSDVYALGVLLYELLTGTTPFDAATLRTAGLDEMRRVIREEEPPRPSARVNTLGAEAASTVTERRGVDRRRLVRLLRGDLDRVVMKALEKDRDRRYESAGAFAADVERYLADEPVEARPASASYRLRKLARRNRAALVTAGLVMAALLTGTGVSAWQAVEAGTARKQAEDDRDRAKDAERRADEEADVAREVTMFFQDDVLRQVDGGEQAELGFPADANLTVKTALDRAAKRIGDRFKDRPKVEGSIRNAIGASYLSLGEPKPAIEHLERAVAFGTAEYGPDHKYTLNASENLGEAYLAADRPADAVPVFARVLEAWTAKHGADHELTLATTTRLGKAYKAAGRMADALPHLERAADTALAKLGPQAVQTTAAAANLANAYVDAGRANDAVKRLRGLLAVQKEKLGPRHLGTLATTCNLANAVLMTTAGPNTGKEATALMEEALAGFEAAVGPDDPKTLLVMAELAEHYIFGKPEAGAKLYERAVEGMKRALGPDHPVTLNTMLQLARLVYARTRNADAVAMIEQVIARQRATLGPNHPNVFSSLWHLGVAHRIGQRPAEAARAFEQAVAGWAARGDGPALVEARSLVGQLGQQYAALNQWDRAAALYREWLARARADVGLGHPDTLTFAALLAEASRRLGRTEDERLALDQIEEGLKAGPGPDYPIKYDRLINAFEAAGQWDRAIAACQGLVKAQAARLGADHAQSVAARERLADTFRKAGRWAEAEAAYRALMDSANGKHGPNHPQTLRAAHGLGAVYENAGRAEEAVALLERVAEQREKSAGRDHPDTIGTASLLGTAYHRAGRLGDAERVMRDVLGRQRARKDKNPQAVAAALTDLGQTLLAQDRPADAESILREAVEIWDRAGPMNRQRFQAVSLLGASRGALGRDTAAEPLLLYGYQELRRMEDVMPVPARRLVAEAAGRVARFYEATGRPDEAKAWRAKHPPAKK